MIQKRRSGLVNGLELRNAESTVGVARTGTVPLLPGDHIALALLVILMPWKT
jgi:hypothetical protein